MARDIELQQMPFAEPEKPARKPWKFGTRHYIYAAVGAFVLLIFTLFASSPAVRDKTGDIIHNALGGDGNSTSNATVPTENAPATDAKDSSPFTFTEEGEGQGSDDDSGFDHKKWWFQQDLGDNFVLPEFSDIAKLSNYPPHNFQGSGQQAFATFFATHNGSSKDPYFIAAQEFVYRLLWDPEKKSAKHPVIVFVLPHISEEQRQYFAAAGAIVRELNVREFEPAHGGEPDRLRDMFTKLEMWRQTDFERIFYIDSDAIPYVNLDEIFDFPDQKCIEERLRPEDQSRVASICDYTFAAWPEAAGGQLNAGVMLLKPNRAMYRRLVRDSKIKDHTWKEDALEQAFLDYEFRDDSPFPARKLDREWNGAVHMRTNDSLNFKIVHTKVWSLTWGEFAWASGEFNQTWDNMRAFYSSPEFDAEREKDRQLAFAAADSQEVAAEVVVPAQNGTQATG